MSEQNKCPKCGNDIPGYYTSQEHTPMPKPLSEVKGIVWYPEGAKLLEPQESFPKEQWIEYAREIRSELEKEVKQQKDSRKEENKMFMKEVERTNEAYRRIAQLSIDLTKGNKRYENVYESWKKLLIKDLDSYRDDYLQTLKKLDKCFYNKGTKVETAFWTQLKIWLDVKLEQFESK